MTVSAPVDIEIFFASHCPTCDAIRTRVNEVVTQPKMPPVRIILRPLPEQIDRAVTLGIVQTPAIVINAGVPLIGLPAQDVLAKAILTAAGVPQP